MKEYIIKFREKRELVVSIPANSVQEALVEAHELYSKGDIELDKDDCVETAILGCESINKMY